MTKDKAISIAKGYLIADGRRDNCDGNIKALFIDKMALLNSYVKSEVATGAPSRELLLVREREIAEHEDHWEVFIDHSYGTMIASTIFLMVFIKDGRVEEAGYV
ncbi:MAG: hypothetical protein K0Q55_1843 [Verrucomicrobia bacterium]|jgi:hypothetical protein|nr:hypothetical protein [Verrucomicrobiota bacterium]